jgi:hypothetical protein
MKIELRKVSHYPRLSEETEAFNADLYIDGVKRATVENDGKGGCNMVRPWQVMEEINKYAATLPSEEMFGRMVLISGDYLISKILREHLLQKDLQKLLKRKTVFVIDGKCYEMKAPHRPGTHEKAQILNDMPFDAAFKLYKQTAVK